MSYSKMELSIIQSEASDYQPATLRTVWDAYESEPTRSEDGQLAAATGGTTMDTGSWTTIDYMAIQNLDDSDTLTLTRKNAAGATVVDRVAAGKIAIITDMNPTTDPVVTSLGAAAVVFSYVLAGA